MMEHLDPGRPFPLGAHYRRLAHREGVQFCVYSRKAVRVDLLLFDDPNADRPSRVIQLLPDRNRTFTYWHVFVPGIRPGQIYAYRVHGPHDPGWGLRFDAEKCLLDPYGRGLIFPDRYDRAAACRPGDNTPTALKSVVVDPSAYDWEGDLPLYRPFAQTVIYEMHVAGFTRNPNSGVAEDCRGTYAGLIEKIPYLKDLGITAVELLPVYAFDPFDAPPGKTNYWGYTPLSFFAPHPLYSSRRDPLGPVDEFRDMVKALHRAGIEVILDVVYNHTAEGNHDGPTLSLKGFENETYYMLEPNPYFYSNYSGTGNTLNANQAVVRRMILDSLRYWVAEMHVDGFRFDLASILSRDEEGRPLPVPPVLFDIETDPYLAGAKLIAEAWDAAGLYQVGSFVGDRWKEWNGRFRDDIRAFVKAEPGSIQRLPNRLLASPDIFQHENREPEQSINFVACHDGFTINDVVSYNSKHNEGNGEGNRDGSDDNRSWNHGHEGPADDPQIENLRTRQVKNFFAYTLLSMGTPMIWMGDEVRRTQNGNNNAYCQDNPLSWFDWSLVERYAGIFRFVKELIHFRLQFSSGTGAEGRTLAQTLQESKITWHGVRAFQPDFSADSHSLGLTFASPEGRLLTHYFFNAYWEPLDFELPPLPPAPVNFPASPWRRLLDTSLSSPEDIVTCSPIVPETVANDSNAASGIVVASRATATPLTGSHYLAAPRSVVVLVADLSAGPGPNPGPVGP